MPTNFGAPLDVRDVAGATFDGAGLRRKNQRDERGIDMTAESNTYVRDQNAQADPMYTMNTITVATLRDILADLPDEAVVVLATQSDGTDACSPLADVEPCWYFPEAGECAPLGRDADGNVHEPGPGDLYAVLLRIDASAGH